MPTGLQASRDLIFWTGVALLVSGGIVFYAAYLRFDELPNFMRLACGFPLTMGWPMVRIDEYLDWKNTKGYNRGYLMVAPAIPALLALGAIAWWLVSPQTRG
jgi:hypothetical protein